jgi:hypothetical protein
VAAIHYECIGAGAKHAHHRINTYGLDTQVCIASTRELKNERSLLAPFSFASKLPRLRPPAPAPVVPLTPCSPMWRLLMAIAAAQHRNSVFVLT